MNIQLIAEQIGRIHLTLETQDAFEVYGGTWLGPFEVTQTGTAQWTLTVREKEVAAAPLRDYKIYARQIATGREWEVLSGKILVSARTAAVPADKLAPVEYFVTVPVVDHDVDAVGSSIVQGIPGPQGPKGDPGPPGEGGISDSERTLLLGAAQRGGDNTFTAANTFTGEVDMSTASVTPPVGWNVEGLTAEAIQAVAPMAWDETSVTFGEGSTNPGRNTIVGAKITGWSERNTLVGEESYSQSSYGTAMGYKARTGYNGSSVGSDAQSAGNEAVAIGCASRANYHPSMAIGSSAAASASYGTALGYHVKTKSSNALTIGAHFTETVDGTNVTHTCTTEGTGSITIGAGANTLNNGDTESSNSVTIGCKASNTGSDSVVIGAQAKGTEANCVLVGAEAQSGGSNGVAIGRNAIQGGFSTSVGSGAYAKWYGSAFGMGANATGNFSSAFGVNSVCNGANSVAVGVTAAADADYATSLGYSSKAKAKYSTAIGYTAAVSDEGATVIRSTASDGSYTQLYFSGANTPLANTYHDGAPMLGYVTKDSAGNIVAAGTRSLIDLLTDNSLTQPASLDENGEWVMPKVFQPSDLDMPQEEPQVPEEYQPLPVWPIVEPEMPEDLPPHGKVEKL